MSVFNYLTSREKNLWVELIVDVAVLAYYLPKAFSLFQQSDEVAAGAAIAGLIGSTIVYAIFLAIVVSIIFEIILSKQKQETLKDERDTLFEIKSFRFGYYSLTVFVALIMGQTLIGEFFPSLAIRAPFDFTPIFISHCLLLALTLSSVIQCCSQLYFYRRGY